MFAAWDLKTRILTRSMRTKIHIVYLLMISAVVLNCLQARPFTDWFATPIYVKSSVSFGYDSNVLKLSNREMDSAGENLSILGDMTTFDSGIIRPRLELEFSPIIFHSRETRFTFKGQYAYFSHSMEKTYSSYSARMQLHLGSYSWLKIGYSLQPDIYLRSFIDRDRIDQTPLPCSFQNETIWSSLSLPIAKQSWITGKVKKNHQYFGSSFTEFDIEKIGAEGRLTIAVFTPLRLSFSCSQSEAENPTYQSGLISTVFDRSYQERSFGGTITYQSRKWVDSITQSFQLSQRFYRSEAQNDPIHSGREQEEFLYGVVIKKSFRNGFAAELNGHYRSRQVFSDFDWVEELKRFSKFDVGITLSNNTILDLFY